MPMYRQLQVYHHAKRLAIQAYACVRQFPKYELFGMSSQLTRAAVSIGSNIVEGQRRGTTKDFRNFVCMAEGSLAEVQYILEIAQELEYIAAEPVAEIWEQSVELEKMLQAFRIGLEKRLKDPPES